MGMRKPNTPTHPVRTMLAAAAVTLGMLTPLAAGAQGFHAPHGPVSPPPPPPPPPPIIAPPPLPVSPPPNLPTEYTGPRRLIIAPAPAPQWQTPYTYHITEGPIYNFEEQAKEKFPDSDWPTGEYRLYLEQQVAEWIAKMESDLFPDWAGDVMQISIYGENTIGGRSFDGGKARYRVRIGGPAGTVAFDIDPANPGGAIEANMGKIRQVAQANGTYYRDQVQKWETRVDTLETRAEGGGYVADWEMPEAERRLKEYKDILGTYSGTFAKVEPQTDAGGGGTPGGGPDTALGPDTPADMPTTKAEPNVEGPVTPKDSVLADYTIGGGDDVAIDLPGVEPRDPSGDTPMGDLIPGTGDFGGGEVLVVDDVQISDTMIDFLEQNPDVTGPSTAELNDRRNQWYQSDKYREINQPGLLDAYATPVATSLIGTVASGPTAVISAGTAFGQTYDHAKENGLGPYQAVVAGLIHGLADGAESVAVNNVVGKVAGKVGGLAKGLSGTEATTVAVGHTTSFGVGVSGAKVTGNVGKALVNKMIANNERRRIIAEQGGSSRGKTIHYAGMGAGFGQQHWY